MANVYRASSPFIMFNAGIPRAVRVGDLVADDDPAYEGREQHFEPVEVAAARMAGVESATAVPGEHRSVSTVSNQTPHKRGRPRRKHEAEKPADEAVEQPSEPTTEPAEEIQP